MSKIGTIAIALFLLCFIGHDAYRSAVTTQAKAKVVEYAAGYEMGCKLASESSQIKIDCEHDAQRLRDSYVAELEQEK